VTVLGEKNHRLLRRRHQAPALAHRARQRRSVVTGRHHELRAGAHGRVEPVEHRARILHVLEHVEHHGRIERPARAEELGRRIARDIEPALPADLARVIGDLDAARRERELCFLEKIPVGAPELDEAATLHVAAQRIEDPPELVAELRAATLVIA